MKLRDLCMVVLGVALAALIGIGHTMATAQEPEKKPVIIVKLPPEEKPLISSENLALSVERTRDGRVIGTLMARVDGEWTPVELAPINALAR